MSGKRTADQPFERKVMLGILIVGTIASVGLAFGPDWMIRAGLGIAIAMAFGSALMARRELDRVLAAHRVELKSVLAASMAQSNQHHRDALALFDSFDARAGRLQATISHLTTQLGLARSELATMRGNSAWLRGEVAERQARIEALEAHVASLESAKREAENNVLNLPRHGVASSREVLPSADELWADGNHPTIVDLAMLAFPDVLDEPERKHA